MTKHKKAHKSGGSSGKATFDFENKPFFALIAFAVIIIALLILFSDFVFSDKMLYGSDTILAGIFFRGFLVDYVHDHGAIPQWNPYIFGGMPYVEAFHGDIFYPLSILKYFVSIYRAMGWNLIIHIFLAGLFMYFAARQFRLSKVASVLSAACYTFAPYLISFVSPGHDGKTYVTALFPLVILFLDRGFGSQGFRKAFFNFTVFGLVIGLIILSPHAQMSYFTLWAAALYTLFKLIVMFRESGSVKPLIRPASMAVYAVVIGLLMSAIQFYPGYKYTTEFSPRADTKRGWEWATSWSLHEEEAFSLLIPEFAGTNSRTEDTVYWGKNAFKDNAESVGIVTIFMALMGFFFYRRKESYFFGGLALFALIYALGATTPFFKLFFYTIPMVKSLRAPSMIMFLFSFSVALLAGMGLQAVTDEKKDTGRRLSPKFNYLLWGLPAVMLVLALLFNAAGRGMLSTWTWFFYSEASTMVQSGVSRFDLAMRNLPAIQSGAWWAFLFTVAAALLIRTYRSGKIGRGILLVLVLLPMMDGVRFNKRFVDVINPADHWSPNVVTQFFAGKEGKYRVMNFAHPIIQHDYLPHFGIEVVVGYHGNQLRWYDQMLGGPALANQANPHFLNLVGAEYVIVPGEMAVPETYFGPESLTVAADYRAIKILHNPNALPRVYLVDQYRQFDSLEDIRSNVLSGKDDLSRIVYLEEAPSLEMTTDSLAPDSAWIKAYEIDSIAVGVEAPGNRILVLTDNYYDAWQVRVDGNPAKLLRSYGTFRAVEIPAGTQEVSFKFDSPRYRTGKLVTGLTSLYVLIIIGFYFSAGWLKGKQKG